MYEVAIEAEACVVQCEITDLVIEEGSPSIWSSDWDAEGYRELEFRVVSGMACDEYGTTTDLGRNGCAAIAEKYAEFIEAELWHQFDIQARG